MRIGILSDTHDRRTRTARAVEILKAEGAEALFHCGDLTTPEIVFEFAELPTYFVLGNNDFDEQGLRHAIGAVDGVYLGFGGEVELAGKRLAMTHGDVSAEFQRLAMPGPHYLFYGHSHVRDDRREGPTRWINPGALHRATEHTVALLDLTNDVLHFLKVG